MSRVKVAALQSKFHSDKAPNVKRVKEQVREAASKGAQIILPSELFESHYFCKEEKDEHFSLAAPFEGNRTIAELSELAKELKVVLPISFFEKAGHAYYNSIAIADADGRVLGLYRKSHIPDGPGYEEKFYFRGGDTGFKTWATKYAKIGVGICWDQWYPECARAMMLQGAEILFYPTAIGSEPEAPDLDTKDLWQRAMIGHAVSNVVPVVASNRTGTEGSQTFYGHSFIASHRGDMLQEMGRDNEGVIVAELDLDLIAKHRASFGFFRDRRPDLYRPLLTADGSTPIG